LGFSGVGVGVSTSYGTPPVHNNPKKPFPQTRLRRGVLLVRVSLLILPPNPAPYFSPRLSTNGYTTPTRSQMFTRFYQGFPTFSGNFSPPRHANSFREHLKITIQASYSPGQSYTLSLPFLSFFFEICLTLHILWIPVVLQVSPFEVGGGLHLTVLIFLS